MNPNEYSQELHCYPFMVKLGRCVGSWNTLNDLSNKVCVPNKTEDLNLSILSTGIYESKTLAKHITCQCKFKFDVTKFTSVQWWNNDKCPCECKKHHICEKDYTWNPSTCSYENGKCLASIMDDSTIVCVEIMNAEAKSYDEETNFIEKK